MIIWLMLQWIGYNIGMSIGRMMLTLTNYLNATPSPGDKPNRYVPVELRRLSHYWDPVAQCHRPRYEAIGDGRFPPRRLVVDASRPMTQAEQQEKINAYFGGYGPRWS